MDKLSDQQLMTEFLRSRNSEALEVIYSRNFNNVYSFVYCRTGNKSLSEDTVSETFLTFLTIAERYDFKSKLSTFLCGIALNKLKQQLWKLKNQGESLAEELIVDEVDEASVDLPLLRQTLQELPNNYSSVLELRFIKGYKLSEVAEALGLSITNVKVIQHRALKKAAEIYKRLAKDERI